MTPLHQEVLGYIRACEHLLSPRVRQLSPDEQELVVHYATEVLQLFAPGGDSRPFAQQTKNPCHASGNDRKIDRGGPPGERVGGERLPDRSNL